MHQRLILHTQLGLANRLRAIASGISFLDIYTDFEMDVIWEPNADLQANYEDLFHPIDHPRINFVSPQKHKLAAVQLTRSTFDWQRRLARLTKGIPSKEISIKQFEQAYPGVNLYNPRFAFTSGKAAYLSTCHNFFPSPRWDLFIPKESLDQKIENSTSHLGKHSVGIHIRRSDNVKSWQKSPFSIFIEKIESILNEQPETKFFLATDSPDVQSALTHIFGKDTISTREGITLDRNQKAGIEEAVVDMWALSRTSRILGSYWSSFSEAAGLIGNVPVTRCVIEEPEPTLQPK